MGPLTRWLRLTQVCTYVLLGTLCALSARAQFSAVWVTDAVAAERPMNLFAQWDGTVPATGFVVDLPSDFQLSSATLLRDGYRDVRVEVQPLTATTSRYLITPPQALRGMHELVLRIVSGETAGPHRWRIVPYTLERDAQGQRVTQPQSAYQVSRHVRTYEAQRSDANRSLRLAPDVPLYLRSDALPDLSLSTPHTVEFWLQTTGLDEVILSTWDGDEQTAYPLELVVDPTGRLRYYHGQPGTHQAMRSRRPVADGAWHHVAVAHDANAGWTRLLVDGEPVDSLFQPSPLPIAHRTPLGLGGRTPTTSESAQTMPTFTGLLDALRLWPEARSVATIQRTMRYPLAATSEQRAPTAPLILTFDEPLPRTLLAEPATAYQTLASDLVFFQPIENLHARIDEEMILVHWETPSQQADYFVVERSTNGQTFEEVATLLAQPGSRLYDYQDTKPDAPVLFYRIRQHFPNGLERISHTIKMGLGEPTLPQTAVLDGNYPNPFNPTTTISFTLNEPRHVLLTVSDPSGKQVAVLLNAVRSEGTYRIPFDAGNLPSGPYFVRMQTEDGVQVHNMMLTK